MAQHGFGNISLPDLIRFQDDILELSIELHKAHEKIDEGIMVASNYWRDNKFDEFRSSFITYSDELENISFTYRRWAETVLQDTIDKVQRHVETNPGK